MNPWKRSPEFLATRPSVEGYHWRQLCNQANANAFTWKATPRRR